MDCVNGNCVRSCSLVNILLQYDLENILVELSKAIGLEVVLVCLDYYSSKINL